MHRVVGITFHCCIVTASQSRSRNSPTSSQTHRQQMQESLRDNEDARSSQTALLWFYTPIRLLHMSLILG